jgi:hypothetical protein
LANVGQTCLSQQFRHTASSDFLAERRSGDLGELDLVHERQVVCGDDVFVRRSDVRLLQQLAQGPYRFDHERKFGAGLGSVKLLWRMVAGGYLAVE